MSTYLWPRNRRDGFRHLAIWAYDFGSGRSGRLVPLCRQDRGNHWGLTSPEAENWPLASQAPICSRCLAKLAELNEAADA